MWTYQLLDGLAHGFDLDIGAFFFSSIVGSGSASADLDRPFLQTYPGYPSTARSLSQHNAKGLKNILHLLHFM